MATFTPTEMDPFIPEVWASEILMTMPSRIVMAKRVTRDSDIASFQVGDVLHIPVAGYLAAQDKTPGTALSTFSDPTGQGTVNVTLNKHKVVPWVFEDISRAMVIPGVENTYVKESARLLGQAIENDLLALYSGFSGPDVGTGGVALTWDTVLAARQLLNANKVDEADRTLVISSKDETALLQDPDLATYWSNSKTEGISEGAIGRLGGFDVFMSQLVPSTAGPIYHNLAFHRSAAILAMRGLPQDNPGARSATIQDPNSGLVLRVTGMYDMNNVGFRVNVDVLYGVAELRDEAGVEVLS